MKFRKERFTLDQMMKIIGCSWKEGVAPYIRHDPNVEYQYRIIRRQSHDGTQMFSNQFMFEAMKPLIFRASFWKPEPPKEGMMPVYTIGDIKFATVYGRVDVPAGNICGQREGIIIPVRVEWVPA